MSEETLDGVITFVKSNLKLAFISLDEQLERLALGKKGGTVSLTFDDGYEDNISVALPILEAHDVPATIFVTTGLIDATSPLWWEALETLAAEGTQPPFTFELMRQRHLAGGGEAVRAEFEKAKIEIDWGSLARRHMMSWDIARSAQDHPLLSIEAHTVTHPNLAALTPAAVRQEMVASRERIQLKTGRRPQIFAYPFGSPHECGQREFDIAKEAGFVAAVTTYPGSLYRRHRTRMFELPRTCLSEPQVSYTLLSNKLSGYDDLRHGRWFGGV